MVNPSSILVKVAFVLNLAMYSFCDADATDSTSKNSFAASANVILFFVKS